jgi:hypothetical protein
MWIRVYPEVGKDFLVNTDNIAYIGTPENMLLGINGERITLVHWSYEELTSKLFPTKKETKPVSSPDTDLLLELHKLTGGKGKVLATPQRVKKLADLIKIFSKDSTNEDAIKAIKRAATNIGKDEFLQGENDSNKRYGDIDYLLRAEKCAKWSEHIQAKTQVNQDPPKPLQIKDLEHMHQKKYKFNHTKKMWGQTDEAL